MVAYQAAYVDLLAEVEEQNKAKVIRFFEEIDKKNFDVFDELHAEDIVVHFPPFYDLNTREAFKQLVQESYVAMPDYNHTIEDMIAKGDKVEVRLTNRGTNKESGKKIEFPVVLIVQFVDGKVVEIWGMIDFLGQQQQLGMELKPKEEK